VQNINVLHQMKQPSPNKIILADITVLRRFPKNCNKMQQPTCSLRHVSQATSRHGYLLNLPMNNECMLSYDTLSLLILRIHCSHNLVRQENNPITHNIIANSTWSHQVPENCILHMIKICSQSQTSTIEY